MSVSDDFLNSMCTDDLQKKIIEVLNNKEFTDLEKMEILVKFIREADNID